MPIQRQSEQFNATEGGLRFAKDYETHDLPEGLVNMLAGPRISAGLNNPRAYHQADLGDAVDTLGKIPGQFNDAANAAAPNFGDHGTGVGAIGGDLSDFGSALGAGFGAVGSGIGDAWNSLTAPEVTQGTPTAPSGVGTPTPTNINAYRQAYGPEQDYGRPGPMHPPGYFDDDSAAHEQYFHNQEHGLDREPPLDPYGAQESRVPVQPLDQFVEQRGATPLAPEPPAEYLGSRNTDYDEQFGPHMGSFTTAHSTESGPAPKQSAAMQPQVVPGWVGHGYVPGHRVGLPWREQLIKGTVTHLDGPQLGVRWDDGQHSTEEPKDLRPI